MSFYPAPISKHFFNPSKAGEIAAADAAATKASFVCGTVLQINLQIENKIIRDAKFKAAGCGYLFAAADVLCEKIIGSKITDGLNVYEVIERELGEFEHSRRHCIELVWQTWQATINNLRAATASGWNDEDALICACFGVSERTIETAIGENLLATVAEVTRACRAGGGCGSCQPLIEDILADVWRG